MSIDRRDWAFGLLSATLLSSGLIFASASSAKSISTSLSSYGIGNATEYPSNLSKFDYLDVVSKEQKEIKIKKNDNLHAIFSDLGLESQESYQAVEAFGKLMNIKHIGPGDRMTAYIDRYADKVSLIGLSFWPDKERQLLLSKSSTGTWNGYELKAKLITKVDRVMGKVSNTLYDDITDQGADAQVVHGYADIFGYNIDFQREIQKGDEFEIVYETMVNEDGEFVKTGTILYASFKNSNLNKKLYRYQANDGTYNYYDETGQSTKRFIMKTPINGARLSSGFGMRRHPILGYTKAHNGTDFAAPIGTPVLAGGDGVVTMAQRYSSYGNYIKIRHNSEYTTAYAHLSRYAVGVRPGAKIKQGQVIGYVGTTGRSTGPHLHYEVYQRGKPINITKLKSPEVQRLTGDELKKFMQERDRIEDTRFQKKDPPPNPVFVSLNNDCPSRGTFTVKCNFNDIQNFLKPIKY